LTKGSTIINIQRYISITKPTQRNHEKRSFHRRSPCDRYGVFFSNNLNRNAMKNELFHFLTSRKIFKNNMPTENASVRTEQRRQERNRGRLVWMALGFRTNPLTKNTERIGKGTYIRNLHGKLK